MSLYNMLMQRNPASPYLLAALGIDQDTQDEWPLGRMRDMYTSEDGSKIFIFTRNGPSGMGLSEEERDKINTNFEKHPQFVRWFLDDFDSTYCTYEFNTPEEYLELVQGIAEVTDTIPPLVRFNKLVEDMKAGKDNEQVANAKKVGEKLFEGLERKLSGGKDEHIKTEDGSIDIVGL